MQIETGFLEGSVLLCGTFEQHDEFFTRVSHYPLKIRWWILALVTGSKLGRLPDFSAYSSGIGWPMAKVTNIAQFRDEEYMGQAINQTSAFI